MKVISMVPISCRVMCQDKHQGLVRTSASSFCHAWKHVAIMEGTVAHSKDCALLSLRLLRVQVCSGHATALQADQGFHLQQGTRARGSGEAIGRLAGRSIHCGTHQTG